MPSRQQARLREECGAPILLAMQSQLFRLNSALGPCGALTKRCIDCADLSKANSAACILAEGAGGPGTTSEVKSVRANSWHSNGSRVPSK